MVVRLEDGTRITRRGVQGGDSKPMDILLNSSTMLGSTHAMPARSYSSGLRLPFDEWSRVVL